MNITEDRRRRQRGLLSSEVPIAKQELARLRAKEIAHDHYLRAARIIGTGAEGMRAEAAAGDAYARGWLACLRLFALTINGGDGE